MPSLGDWSSSKSSGHLRRPRPLCARIIGTSRKRDTSAVERVEEEPSSAAGADRPNGDSVVHTRTVSRDSPDRAPRPLRGGLLAEDRRPRRHHRGTTRRPRRGSWLAPGGPPIGGTVSPRSSATSPAARSETSDCRSGRVEGMHRGGIGFEGGHIVRRGPPSRCGPLRDSVAPFGGGIGFEGDHLRTSGRLGAGRAPAHPATPAGPKSADSAPVAARGRRGRHETSAPRSGPVVFRESCRNHPAPGATVEPVRLPEAAPAGGGRNRLTKPKQSGIPDHKTSIG
jgi:hypothetical protein